MKLKIAVLQGDGIGPEVTTQAIKVLDVVAEKFHHRFTYDYRAVGASAIELTGTPLPEESLNACMASDAVLFGAIGDPKYDNDPEAKIRPEQGLLRLRKELGLYANIRPVKAFPHLVHRSPLKENRIAGTDFVIYRELTGGIYFGEKLKSKDGNSASDLCAYTAEEIERIAHLAFHAARARRGKLTLVDKANVLETSRLWRNKVAEIAKQYSDIQTEYLFVDNAAMQLILNPGQFDVILTENMFGDILSDEAGVIGGSIGLLASASVGKESSLFEPVHGSYPQAKGKDIANPLASILSAAMLLEHFELYQEANTVRQAVEKSLEENVTTSDVNENNPFSTTKVGDFIAEFIFKT